jgi:hypothetical protein
MAGRSEAKAVVAVTYVREQIAAPPVKRVDLLLQDVRGPDDLLRRNAGG